MAVTQSASSIMLSVIRMRLARIADGLAIAVAVSLPWSISAASILILFWLLALLPTLDPGDVRQEIQTPAGGLPVALFVLGALGMTWTDVSWAERLGGLDSFAKLLMIPLLLVQFRHSDGGLWVMAAYLASCTALLVVSSTFALWTGPTFMFTEGFGVPVKNAPTQDGEFVSCIFALLFLAIDIFRRGRRSLAGGMLVLALVFLANILSHATLFLVPVLGLVIFPVLLVLLAFKKFSTKGMFGLLAAGATLCAASWVCSPYLQHLTMAVWKNIQPYPGDERNWAGPRPVFWKKSLSFVGEAPVFGQGSGSIPKLFVRSAVGQTGYSGWVTTDPLNQTFAVGIQLGLVGVAALWAMWISHLLLFRGNTLPEWIGLMVVTQNIVGSLLNSHLFDFTQGWTYVFGVGVAGGMVSRLRADKAVR